MTMADELQKLQTLREQGALTDDEFLKAKQRVINDDASSSSSFYAEKESPPPTPTTPAATNGPVIFNTMTRSLHDRWIGGVCGGLAVATGIPAWAWRILFVLTALLHGLGLLMYVLLWIFVPLAKPDLQQRSGSFHP